MRARYISGISDEKLLDPVGSHWKKARSERVKLEGTPLDLQPTAAVRVSWAGKKIGAVDRVEVAVLHNGSVIAFHLRWRDREEDSALRDTTDFPDAAGVLFPVLPGAQIITMGAPGLAVNAWQWRADENEKGQHVVAEGLGTTRPVGEGLVRTRGAWKDGQWHVVISRALLVSVDGPAAQLKPGESTGFGVAVWEGAQGERAGIKAFSGANWLELKLDPTAGDGR